MTFEVIQPLDSSDIDRLIRIFHQQPESLWHQDYNLFDVDKRPIPSIHWGESWSRKLQEAAGVEISSHYFVLYKPDSFTRIHKDDVANVGCTIITMLEQNDLVGGDTLIFDEYKIKARGRDTQVKRTEKKRPYMQPIIPVVPRVEDGQSIKYDRMVKHGVTRVESGTRLVLVSWFKTIDYEHAKTLINQQTGD